MPKQRSLIVGCALGALAGAVLPVAGQVAGAGGALGASPAPVQVPDGYQRIVDDTGTIAVSVPISWTVENTAPIEGVYGDGIPRPAIGAGKPVEYENWQAGVGVSIIVHPYSGPVERWDPSTCDPLQGECDALVSEQPYDNGRFGGWRQLIEMCCGGGPYERVVAAAHDQSFMFELIFSYRGTREPAEVEILDTILASVEPAGASLPPPTTTGTAEFPFASFYDVSQLGGEPVRGSGCGGTGQLGDTIPDGWWAGFATFASDNNVDIDVVCVFSGASAQAVLAEGTATILSDDPDFLVVNNNTRVRTMPNAPDVVTSNSMMAADGRCVPAPQTPRPGDEGVVAWLHIVGGQVRYILWGCESLAITAAGDLPPAYPGPSTGEGVPWPYGEFWNVPQLGREPVRGSGCGADGRMPDAIPDGLWAGYISYDAATDRFWIDLLCIFAGDTAQAVIAEGTANIVNNEPDYLIVNNSDKRRAAANDLRAIAYGADVDGRCRPFTAASGDHLTPDQGELRPDGQAWIRIAGGAVTWILSGCHTG
jgi:hypothetical protein